MNKVLRILLILLAFGLSLASTYIAQAASLPTKSKPTPLASVKPQASFPLTYTLQTGLRPSDGQISDGFGSQVQISGDGNTALICGNHAYIFERSGNIWVQQQILTDPNNTPYTAFASECSLSQDGSTALIGAATTGEPSSSPVVYSFVRNGNTWNIQQRLTPTDNLPSLFGLKLALSADGNIALVDETTLSGSSYYDNADVINS